MATIKQIAELAGVSRGTVDRVLNNRGSVNANTAARVREIAEKLNYKPNKAGLMLAAQKKNLKIGVILFPDSNPFFSEVLEGVNAKAKELSAYNFTVLIRQVPFDETEQFNTMEALLAEGINGLVIAPFNSLYIAAEIDRLTEMNIPVITVNTDILSRRIAYVGSNYRLSGQTAAVGLGRSKQAIFFSLLRKAFIVIPLTLILPRLFSLGVNGVFLAEPISNFIGGAACFVTMIFTVYRRLGK